MSKKIQCSVTGNIYYITDYRYAKLLSRYGSDEGIKKNYVSAIGKKVRDGIIDMPRKIKNRIKCSVTGNWCYISNQRIKNGIEQYGSWEEFCKHYISRQ